jgi:hypothetical protein
METVMSHQIADAIGTHVHAIHFPIGGVQNAVGKMVTDKTVHAKNQDFFHIVSLREYLNNCILTKISRIFAKVKQVAERPVWEFGKSKEKKFRVPRRARLDGALEQKLKRASRKLGDSSRYLIAQFSFANHQFVSQSG